jgi:hypothetical protein
MHATLDFCAHGSFIFRQVRPRGFLSRAAIENFFNQVGTHLLQMDDLVLNSSLELDDVLGQRGCEIANREAPMRGATVVVGQGSSHSAILFINHCGDLFLHGAFIRAADACFFQLVEKRAIADLQNPGRCFAVPTGHV